jgi:hypothetical protein
MPVFVHVDQEISNVVLLLEEHVFQRCKIKDCRLFDDGGPFEWVDASFENCQWSFREAAQNTCRMLQMLGLLKVDETPPATLSTSTTVH